MSSSWCVASCVSDAAVDCALLLGLRLRAHVAVVARLSPHEAFDAGDQAAGAAPPKALHELCCLDAWLASRAAEAGLGPAPRRMDVVCPAYLADNRPDLDRLASFCAQALRRELA